MLNLILGRSGSLKTTYVHSILGELAQTSNDKLLIIVPEQFSFATERKMLARFGTLNAQNIEVLSFSRLADYVNRITGGLNGDFADEGAKIILMLRALESVKLNLNFYSKHTDSISLAKQLIALFSEFHKERVSYEMLENASKEISTNILSMKVSELALIFEAYTSLLENSYSDTDTLPDRLVDILKHNNIFKGFTIAIDAFKGFTSQEFEIIRLLTKQSDNVYITLCTPDIYARDASLIWDAVNETGKRLVSIAKSENIGVKKLNVDNAPLKNGARFKSSALAYLEENIFSPVAEEYKGNTTDISICSAASLYDECDYIAATVRKLIRLHSYRLRDIAVIVRHEDEYLKEISAAFTRYKIPVFEDLRQPINNQPIIAYCKSVLTILATSFSTDNILQYLKTGLSPITDIEASELENYALMWNLQAKDWKKDFTLNPIDINSGSNSESENMLNKLNALRKKVICPLLELKKELIEDPENSKYITAEIISKAFYGFLIKSKVQEKLKAIATQFAKDGYIALANEQNKLWEVLMDALSKLATIHGDFRTSLATYYNLFCAVIDATDLGNIPNGLDEVTIGSADRIRLDDTKVVFVAGCEEGVFPSTNSDASLLTESDRRALKEIGIELSNPIELQASEERFIAYTALTAASEKLYVSYHRTEGSGTSLLPSEIIKSMHDIFNIDEIDTDEIPNEYFAETEVSTFGAFAKAYAHESKDSDILKSVLSCNENMRSKIEVFDTVVANKPYEIKDPNIATELFGKRMFLSASKVDAYHQCPFRYFCQFGIKAKPRSKAELRPNVSGTIIHYVLENVIKEIGRDRLIEMSIEERNKIVDKWLKEYLTTYIGGFDDKTLRFEYLYSRLSFALYDIVTRLVNEFKESSFIPCNFELAIGKDEDPSIEAYKLDLPNGGEIKISGSIDRVDKYEKDGKTYIKIVDYKSGGKDFVLSDILDGLNMQMLIYLFSIWNAGEELYGNVVPGGIMYYTAKKNYISMTTKHMDPDEIEKEKMKKDISNGLFLMDEDMLDALEHDMGGKYISIKTAKGKYKDNVVTLNEMGLLKQRIDSILKEMASNLQSGAIEAFPVHNSRYEHVCDYCDYSSVCRFEDGEKKELIKISNQDVLNILRGVDEDELEEEN